MRTLSAVLVGVLIGLVSAALTHSDAGLGELPAARVALVAALFVVGGLAIGWLARGSWGLAAVCAWFTTLVSVMALVGLLGGPRSAPTSGVWLPVLGFLLLPYLLSLFGGFVGSRLVTHHLEHSGGMSDPPAA